jgi:hypothetical protein
MDVSGAADIGHLQPVLTLEPLVESGRALGRHTASDARRSRDRVINRRLPADDVFGDEVD